MSVDATCAVCILLATNLTLAKWRSLSNQLKREISLDESDYEEEDFIEQDYVYWELTIGEKLFCFYHGFPGDNPRGVLLEGEEAVLFLWEGEGNVLKDTEEVNIFLQWYKDQTESGCHYGLDEFKASILAQRSS